MKNIKIGEHVIPLWLIIVLLISGITAVLANYVWNTLIIPLEVKEPLEVLSYPSELSLFSGETTQFNITVLNHASINYTITFVFSLENLTYQEAYVIFSDETYLVISGIQNVTAWFQVLPNAPAINTSLTVDLYRLLPLIRISSGKIAYDTFSASSGTATDIPWTILNGDWTIEDGKFKSVALPAMIPSYNQTAIVQAFPTGINVTDGVWEVKVYPLILKTEGPEMLFSVSIGIHTLAFDYHHSSKVLRSALHVPGHPSKFWQEVSFTMETGKLYVMKIVLSGSNIKAFVDNNLFFDITDPDIADLPARPLSLYGYYDGEAGYWDDVKVWKSNMINVTSLETGQKIELYNENGTLIQTGIVEEDKTFATLNVSSLSFPFKGYFKVYADDGITLLYRSLMYNDIWGGDEYSGIPEKEG